MIIQIASILNGEKNRVFDNINRVFADAGLNATDIDTIRLNDGTLTVFVTCEIIEGSEKGANLIANLSVTNIVDYNKLKAHPEEQNQLWFGNAWCNAWYSIRLVDLRFE
jgi:hypothetical protein